MHVVLFCIFMMTDDVEFSYAYFPFIYIFWKNKFSILKNQVVCLPVIES